jgi:hypothetical protein
VTGKHDTPDPVGTKARKDIRLASIVVVAQADACAMRFEVGDRAGEVRIGRVGGVPTAAVFAELLSPAVLDRLVDRVDLQPA